MARKLLLSEFILYGLYDGLIYNYTHMKEDLEKLYDLIRQMNYLGDSDRNLHDLMEEALELSFNLTCDKQKVYQVTWFNGEFYPEMQERKIMGIFLTMEKAQSYVDKWRENYIKESEEIATKDNYSQYPDYCFKFYFPEEMWISEYEII